MFGFVVLDVSVAKVSISLMDGLWRSPRLWGLSLVNVDYPRDARCLLGVGRDGAWLLDVLFFHLL